MGYGFRNIDNLIALVRACPIIGNVYKGEQFLCQSRQDFAGIIGLFREILTKSGAKIAVFVHVDDYRTRPRLKCSDEDFNLPGVDSTHTNRGSPNFNGLSTAISAAFPKVEQQLCIIHQIRNSTKYVSYKDLEAVTADLKAIYQAPSEDDALYYLEEFAENWGSKYPQISKSWRDNWSELCTYFKYPADVRRLIYTANAVEGFHRMLRKFTKTKTTFPNDDALKKSIYLSLLEIEKNGD